MKKGAWAGLIFGFIFLITYCFYARPTISIVMSTYNRAPHIDAAIQSALTQTNPDFEFIIINDGSTDNTADILKRYAAQDKRIRIITNSQNQGLIASLNTGIKAARGAYIARLDDDDKMLPTRLEKQLSYVKQNPQTTVLATGFYPLKAGKRGDARGCPSPTEQVLINMHFANGIAHPTTLLNRAFLQTHALRYNADFPAAEDYKLWQDILLAGGQIHCLDEPLMEYTVDASHSGTFYKKQYQSAQKIRLIYLNRLFPATAENLSEPACSLLTKMSAANRTKNLLDETLLEKGKNAACHKIQNAYYVQHPHWKDYFIFDSNTRLHRDSNKSQTATILSFEDNILTVKWDDWGTERFMCDSHKLCHLMP